MYTRVQGHESRRSFPLEEAYNVHVIKFFHLRLSLVLRNLSLFFKILPAVLLNVVFDINTRDSLKL